MKPHYRRVLLKMSGEALAGKERYGIDHSIAEFVVDQLLQVHSISVEVGLVIGGGNIFRGISGLSQGIDRIAGDSAGMLATVINGLIMQDMLNKKGIPCILLTARAMESIGIPYTPQIAIDNMKKGTVVIIAGGTGNPYFSTDTAAALRCAETKCDVLLKATKVDGIYTSDPVKDPMAVKIPSLTHQEALARDIRVMDATSFSLCMENGIPIVVFKLLEQGNLYKTVTGEIVGSIVRKGA